MSTQILGKVSVILKGEYNASTTYVKLDIITYQGESYIAKTTTVGNLPTNTEYWDKLAEKGYTPIKGTDYWTASEQSDIVNSAKTGVETEIQPTLTEIGNTASSADTKADTAISTANTAKSIADGANQTVSFENYSNMITQINNFSNTKYRAGQNIMIRTDGVPDLWVYSVEETSIPYTYVDDETFANAVTSNVYVQVGYYRLSPLETQKVDLTDYVTNTDYATSITGGVVKVTSSNGIDINSSTGQISTSKATNIEIDGKANNYRPIVPSNLDYAVSSIVGHHETKTQAQYDALVSGGTVDSNTYYYIVEE